MAHQAFFEGVTDAQKSLVAYWQDLRDASGRVQRRAINPGHFKSQLASISIIEFRPGEAGRFRIAGSRLRDIFGMEARGLDVSDVHGSVGEAYALGLSAVRERGLPVGGVIDTGKGLHAWLRLPLVDAYGVISQVLCHDELIRVHTRKSPDRKIEKVIPIIQQSVAA